MVFMRFASWVDVTEGDIIHCNCSATGDCIRVMDTLELIVCEYPFAMFRRSMAIELILVIILIAGYLYVFVRNFSYWRGNKVSRHFSSRDENRGPWSDAQYRESNDSPECMYSLDKHLVRVFAFWPY